MKRVLLFAFDLVRYHRPDNPRRPRREPLYHHVDHHQHPASGLLDVLLPEFEKEAGITVKVIAKGTGAAIRDGVDGNVDLIFVHDKSREEKFIADGFGTQRYGVMHNDFVIVGPPEDPAQIKGLTDAAKALNQIAAKGAVFVSRGDDSGTHAKEQALWRLSGVPLAKQSATITKKGKEADRGV